MRVYADNAATTRMSRAAIDAMLPYMDEVYGNPSRLHRAGQAAAEALAEARARIAQRLGCFPHEITFTSGGSESDNQAVLTAAQLGIKAGKRHVVSTSFEHPAVRSTLQALEKDGFEVTWLDVHESGVIAADEVAEAIRPDTCLVTVMYANNEIGTIQPIPEIGAVCRKAGVLFHTDAVQAAGYLPIHAAEQNVDLLSLSAHKFHGPKGVGVLYARQDITLQNLIRGGHQERGKRAGTENVPAIMGMAAALDEVCDRMDAVNARLIPLRDRLIRGLLSIPHTVLNGDPVRRLPNNAHVCFEGVEGEALLLLLDAKGICASSGAACMSGTLEPSHVLLAVGRSPEAARGALRLTLGEDVTCREIDYIIDTVTKAVPILREMSPTTRQ